VDGRLPRPTVRLRLTLLYAGVLVVCGALLLGTSYMLVKRNLNVDPATVKALTNQRLGIPDASGPPPPLSEARLEITRQVQADLSDHALAELRSQYALALAAMALGAVALGWVLAGRALRPLSDMTTTARRVSEDSLDQRIGHEGPDDELKELADTIDGMLARLDAAFATQHRFVANASHELRTPLAVIRTEVDVALADPDASAEELRAMAERVRDASDRSERLIESLLTLARSEGSVPRQDHVDLAAAVELAVDQVAGEIRERGLSVRRNLEHAPVRGDRRLLERLVANLVENAVRHNVAGGWIDVTTGVDGDHAVLAVENGGERIAPEMAERLVEPFERGARHARGSGAGLGLSIVRSVAEVHNGSLCVAARQDGGLAVTVNLPARSRVFTRT
jgi:signal transduction histidine kinase